MKKTNKILARALVIILSLVLITSCVVSSTFAKYVVSKSASTTVNLQKFGLMVSLTYDDDNMSESTTTPAVKKGDSVVYTLDNVTLVPGENKFQNAFTASVSGTATVPATLKIEVKIENANDEYFNISSEHFTSLKPDQYGVYNPLTFYVGGDEVSNITWKPLATGNSGSKFKTSIETALGDTIKGKITGATSSAGVVTKSITANETVNVDGLGIGFAWLNPPKNTGLDCLDEISTWISSSSEIPQANTNNFKITYTISVEQDTTASN